MRIGIIGTRGIPNRYGGYEQFVEYAAPALVRRGHEVYVYNSSLHPYKERTWKGVNIISKYDPENRIGTAGQFIYDFNCILDSRKRNFDIILQLGYTSSSIWNFLFPKTAVVVTNMDGWEWKRGKYSKIVRRFLLQAEKWAALKSDHLIADSKGIQQYLLEKYNRDSAFIPYGAEPVINVNDEVLKKRGITKFNYNLVLSRMEPENNIETIIRGHLLSGSDKPLILIGNHQNRFGSALYRKYHSEKIRFWGAEYNMETLNSLRHFACFYFHGHSVGGTNPSLLEAMASYVPIIAHDNIFNRTVLENDAFYFNSAADITAILDNQTGREGFKTAIENNAARIRNEYNWEHIINLLENYLRHVAKLHTTSRR
jgi:glycosyltransferase involved in cell wall biosynthesis